MKSSLNQDNLVNDHWFDSTNNVNWPPLGVSKLTFRALALRHSLRQRTNARNVSFETLNDDQFMLPNYLVILSHWRSTTVSLETYPLYWIKPRSKPYSIFFAFFGPNINQWLFKKIHLFLLYEQKNERLAYQKSAINLVSFFLQQCIWLAVVV